MNRSGDFVVYAGSESYANSLEDYLTSRGFLVVDSPSESSMVVISNTRRDKLAKAVKKSGLDLEGQFVVRKVVVRRPKKR